MNNQNNFKILFFNNFHEIGAMNVHQSELRIETLLKQI